MNAFETLLHGGLYRSCCIPLSPFSPIIFHFLTWLTKQNGRNVDQREGEELYRLLGLIAAKPIFPNFRVYTQLECSIRLKAQKNLFPRSFTLYCLIKKSSESHFPLTSCSTMCIIAIS